MDHLEGRFGASTWAGVVDGLWSTGANWDIAPTVGADLSFAADGANRANTNDLAAGLDYGTLSVAGDSYAIGGNAIGLTGLVEATYASGESLVSLPMLFAETRAVSVANQDASLVLGGVISGAGGLVKEGLGALTLTADNTYLGGTTASAGSLFINGTQTGAVLVTAGGTVGGTGTVGAITSSGGTVQPGTTAPGVLTGTGGLSLDVNSRFSVALDGLIAGDEYSQLVVAGTVDLGGATLDVALGFQPTGAPSFTVIDNTGADQVSGIFAGLAEGATFAVSTESFKISYVGGDGNDVVLTRLAVTTTTLDASAANTVFSEPVTLTATVAPDGPTASDPAGTVSFFAGATSLGSGTLSNGVATLTTGAIPVGENDITAQYLGEGDFLSSTSDAVTVSVAQAQTTTTLEAVPTTSVFGQNVALTATVAAVSPGEGTPTGNVEFFNGLDSLGTATIVFGVATLNTGALPLGSNSVTAEYISDGNFVASASDAATVTVSQASTNTTVAANPNPAAEGELVTLSATVAAVAPGGGLPTGLVEFFNGAQSLGTAEVIGGVATFETSSLPLAANVITASYGGDENFEASDSPELIVNVRLASTTILGVDPTASSFGQEVTLTADVSGNGLETPTGQVAFFNGQASLGTADLVNGVAVLATTALPAGDLVLTARYLGDEEFAPSTSAGVDMAVAQAQTTTTVTAAPTSSVFGQNVALTVTVEVVAPAVGTPTGVVEFFSGLTSVGTAILNAGSASIDTASLPVGDNAITARYLSDDGNFVTSVSAPISVVVSQAATTTTLTAAPTSSVFGENITLTAAVSVVGPGEGEPTGSVEFFNGPASIGTAAIVAGVATLDTASLPVGVDSITARYLGDDNFVASTSDAASVTVSQAGTTTTLTTNPNPSTVGDAVTLTATVTVNAPGSGVLTGSVEFHNGSTSLGVVSIANGQAVLNTTALPVGSNAITARYVGDANFEASTSPVATQVVNLVGTTTTLAASDLNPAPFTPVTLTAAVATASANVSPTGTVQFLADGALLGTADVIGGQASITVDSLPVGVLSITAEYSGDASASASVSDALTVTVGTANERYVNQLYLSIFGREAEAAGLSFWSGLLDQGRSRASVVAPILNGREGLTAQVETAYQTYLGRSASPAEVARTVQAAFNFGTNIEGVVLSTREFYQTAGGGTISGYLDALGEAVFGGPFEPATKSYLAGRIRDGEPLVGVVTDVLTSGRGKYALVQSSIETIFGGSPNPGEVEGYLSMMGGNILLRQINVLLYASEEFYVLATGEPPATA